MWSSIEKDIQMMLCEGVVGTLKGSRHRFYEQNSAKL
jgi:hypothetical protein